MTTFSKHQNSLEVLFMAGGETYAADYADDYEEEYYEEAAPAPSGGRRPGGAAGGGPGRPGGGPFRPRRKVCSFCVDKMKTVSYKDVSTLQRFLDDHGKIKARRKTGTCARHQRRLAVAIKRARHLALLPFTAIRSPYTER
jgi:small subunit ribosomal protein S18